MHISTSYDRSACSPALRRLLELALVVAISFGAERRSIADDKSERAQPERLASQIDLLLAKRWQRDGVQPASGIDDAAYLRRISLDLNGRIPTVAEVRTFLADKRSDKRKLLVDERLRDADYVRHMANVWRALFLSSANPQDVAFLTPKWEGWLRRRFAENTPYDEMVRRILTVPLDARPPTEEGAAADRDDDALAFFQAGELKPENLSAATSRFFLGINLDCAQCHKHPFADWKQEQFWEFASFFAGVRRLRDDNSYMPGPELRDAHQLEIPGKKLIVQAKFLYGAEPRWSAGRTSRESLADWTVSADNRYFARAAANRMWAHFLGRGLIEPLDGLGAPNIPDDEILDLLARQFILNDFDLTYLIRAIAATKAYRLSGRSTDKSQSDPKHFARMPARGLSPEQVYDSLAIAVGLHKSAPAETSVATTPDDSVRADLLVKFNGLERPIERQASIVQALTLMNGRFTADATALDGTALLTAVAASPFLDRQARIETLYLATLSRPPSPEEAQVVGEFIASHAEKEPAALADLLWVLLNSGEFLLNH